MNEVDIRPGRVLLVAIVALAATVPIWALTFPPMVDVPQHAAQAALLHAIQNPAFQFRDIYRLNWFTPYLLGYLLVYLLAPMFGVLMASKVVIVAALAALPVATALLLREAGGDERWAIVTALASFGFAFQWGFLNLLVAAPLGILFLQYIIRYGRAPTTRRSLWLAAFAIVLFFCHAMICVFVIGIGACYLVCETDRREIVRRLAPLAAVAPMMILWLTVTARHPIAQSTTAWSLDPFTVQEPYYASLASWTSPRGFGWGRVFGFFPRLFGVRPGLILSAFGILVFALPLLGGARVHRRLSFRVPFLICLVTLLIGPDSVRGIAFTYQHFIPFLIPFYLVMLTGPHDRPLSRWCWVASTIVAAAWIGAVIRDSRVYEFEASSLASIVDRMEPGERAVSLMFERDSDGTIAPTFLHFGAWYSAVKAGVVDPSMANTYTQLVLFRPGRAPKASDLGFEWAPNRFDWNAHRGVDYRYFVIRSREDRGTDLFREATCAVALVEHQQDWWLYERNPTCVGPGR